jgi:eukaryotic-like serine/threonine-protein kinase
MKIGKVKVLEELGKSAGSRVYRVCREEDAREYALKVVPCDNRRERKYLEHVQNEYRIGSYLKHPNIIEIYCLEIEEGWFTGPKKANLLTQFAPGRTMDRLPRIPIPRLLRIFERIASAVAHMHARGVIHADLKPNNLILDSHADVKVIDFGIAQLRGEQKDRIYATREFMAPETGTLKLINERTDIYSFGATMYRLATLRAPLPTLTAVLKGEREFEQHYVPANAINPRVPGELSDLIGDCMSYRPDHRPRSMAEVEKLLTQMARRSDDEPVFDG